MPPVKPRRPFAFGLPAQSFLDLRVYVILLALAGVILNLVGSSPVAQGASSPASSDLIDPAAEVRLSISPPTPWVKRGETVTFALYADGGTGVSAAEVKLEYGSDLQVVAIKPGPYLGRGALTGPKLIDEKQRRATHAWARVGETPAQGAPGEVAFITMKATGRDPWNTWGAVQVKLADGQFQKFQTTTLSFNFNVYDRLPGPTLVRPSSAYPTTGELPSFAIQTRSPGTFQYRIEVSQDRFQSVLQTFDQTRSATGWSQAEYQTGEVAEFNGPDPLEPGAYQWRASVWTSEIGQWGPPGQPQTFEVSSGAVGLTAVSPKAVTRIDDAGTPVTLHGWGFTPDIQASLVVPGRPEVSLGIHPVSDFKVLVDLPPETPPGLAQIRLSGKGTKELTVPVLVFPPGLFRVRTDLPWANQIVPDQEFSVRTRAFNLGGDPERVAVVAVHLPDPELFTLLDVETGHSGQLLDRDEDLVLLSVRDRSEVTFKFQLSDELVDPQSGPVNPALLLGSFLDFNLRPVVLGTVSSTRWAELELWPLTQRIVALQQESAQDFREFSRRLNSVSDQSLPGALEKVARGEASVAELLSGDIDATCCNPGPHQLQLVTSIEANDLVGHPSGIGDSSYITPDQAIKYTLRFENPAEATAQVANVTAIAQLGPGADMSSLVVGESSHPDAMKVEIDSSGNTITWTFSDINLPANREAPEGEGWVRFSAFPLDGLSSGDSIVARAAIRFDFNSPVVTNEVTHTVDSGAPDTRIRPIPSVQLDPRLQIAWEGGDEAGGSGIQKVALLVSKNGGPFKVAEVSSGASFSFQGEPGVTYGFATQGSDRVGHVEAPPANPDVVVTVGQALSFAPGLHLVGIPVDMGDGAQQTLAVPGSTWSTWDASQQTYLLQQPSPVSGPGVASSPGRGLWAEFDQQAELVITGRPIPDDRPYPLDLHAGWNLIANPFVSAVAWSIDSIKVRSGGQEMTLREGRAAGWVEDYAWSWNGEGYEVVYDPRVIPGIASGLQPFQGYWMESHRDLTLLLPPPSAAGN